MDLADIGNFDFDEDRIFDDLEIQVFQPRDSYQNPFTSDYLFQDWTSDRANTGEPRNNDASTDFNQSISHVTVQDSGFGYLMPVEVTPLGGTPNQATLQAWVDAGNTFPMFSHATLQVESNGTDSNGSILETNSSIRVVDGGYGYADPAPGFLPIYTAPSIIISGGGGMGAEAEASMGERFIVPIGSSLVSIGILNPDLVDFAGDSSLELDENTTLLAGEVVVKQIIRMIILSFSTTMLRLHKCLRNLMVLRKHSIQMQQFGAMLRLFRVVRRNLWSN